MGDIDTIMPYVSCIPVKLISHWKKHVNCCLFLTGLRYGVDKFPVYTATKHAILAFMTGWAVSFKLLYFPNTDISTKICMRNSIFTILCLSASVSATMTKIPAERIY